MDERKYINWLSVTVLFLVSTVTVISFILSYEALWNFALAGGKPQYLAWLWPVIIDLPIVVFSVVALFAVALGCNPWPFRLVVGLVTAGTIWFNYSYAVSKGLSWEVYVTAPLMYFVSFEVLVWVIKIVSERSVLITKIAEISAKLGVLEIEYQSKKDNLESELGQLAEAKRSDLVNLESEYSQQASQLQEQIETMERTIQSYQSDIEARQKELKSLDNSNQIKAYIPANLTAEQRQELVNRMSQEKLTQEQIAKALGVSVGTIKNIKKANEVAMNGRVN